MLRFATRQGPVNTFSIFEPSLLALSTTVGGFLYPLSPRDGRVASKSVCQSMLELDPQHELDLLVTVCDPNVLSYSEESEQESGVVI